MNISSLSLARTLSPPARLPADSIIASRMNSPSHGVSPPCVALALMTGGRLSSSGLNGWASQARKPQTSLTVGGPPPVWLMKNGNWLALTPSSASGATGSARMPGLLDMTCGSPLVKTMTSPTSSAIAS